MKGKHEVLVDALCVVLRKVITIRDGQGPVMRAVGTVEGATDALLRCLCARAELFLKQAREGLDEFAFGSGVATLDSSQDAVQFVKRRLETGAWRAGLDEDGPEAVRVAEAGLAALQDGLVSAREALADARYLGWSAAEVEQFREAAMVPGCEVDLLLLQDLCVVPVVD
eukprot:CAMPEP_0204310818 /NCGR_PEP_ID=MMETSP0469-20131031/1963_1 /ASSEMBLY_ACC=CAM_ASM_000384 /TAXON_ID=2969 /ORGANISM="Oxyrrhis marina" /LENGTH=168 /DNA_ID=CAMNT_0051290663 /DNA_START=78 /DNA_END=581 /DNA_ORIENTATION=+